MLGFIPDEWLHSLDYSTLEKVPGSYVSDGLRHRADDVVWRVRTGGDWVYLYLMIEFQSQPDRWMAVRMMSYVGLLYQDLIRRKEFSADQRLPPVLPIVLYNGDARWTAPTDVADLVPKVPGLVAQYLPRMQYLLLDEGELARRTDPGRLKNLVAAVVRLEHPETDRGIITLIDELNEWLDGQPELKRIFAIWIRAVLLRRNKGAWVVPKVQDLKELKMGLAEKMDIWAQEYQRQGWEKGRQEMRQAQILVLQRMLARRFGELPPQALERIQHAAPEQVGIWTERVLDAATLEDVLAP